jgi:phosphoglycolate phosphatase-like HAD superfamily hydrolase
MDGLKHFRAQAIIFDKDGTLIDFDAMWGGWSAYLAAQLQNASGVDVRAALYEALGYDAATHKVLAGGKLASRPMSHVYEVTVEVMQSLGLGLQKAELVVEQAWCIPDPVMLAKPLTDLRMLFANLHKQGVQIAIATADDRLPTQAMLEAFDIEEYIATMVCADDGIPSKPAPDMVTTICDRLKMDPGKVMVIGDTTSDLKMARAAGAGLAVGVLSGVSAARDLMPHADVILDSVDEFHAYAEMLAGHKPAHPSTDLSTELVF